MRILDFFLSLLGLIILSPILLIIAVCIKLGSKGPVLFKQKRVGKDGIEFDMYKFRSMRTDAENEGYLTVGNSDKKIG
jgi:lipopolysaccharide/colanic/teichoic acid biosynthesis glycosyltransferase